jgi:hypothetical protein
VAIVTVTEGPGTAEQAEATHRALKQAGAPEPLVHIAGPVEGGFRVTKTQLGAPLLRGQRQIGTT